ncbi:BamA/TamA family outer membrane protein [uncultured Draconibacterium sp.]|uniref:BamA/TamA family outer membrane protein n=1 Tax=uncultured Draconibacterium sp. TaxID=1573823 RepID=UPI002AA8DA2A|nr:BamA/TamA family outer membrane protein [uncultured Draconibacterium sp.]
MKFKNLLLITITVLLAINSSAQKDSVSVDVGKFYISPLPILSSNPAFGFMYGAAASAGVFFGDPSTTSMSNGVFTGSYSTKKQLMFTFKSTVYSPGNEWMLMGDWRLFFSSQPTYGLGTGPQADDLSTIILPFDIDENIPEGELMEFNLIRFHQTALKQVLPNFYLGLGYHLDVHFKIDDHLLDLEADPPVLTNHYRYSTENGFNPEKYTTSGVSANVIYDSRDNVANPYTGRFAFASFRAIPKFLGSTKNATTLWLEYRDYISLSALNPRNLLAFWTYGNFTTSGTLPYMNLPALGWDQMGRSGRAFPQGRFRGEHMYYAEAEWRFPLTLVKRNPDLLGGVVFANMTTAANESKDVKLFQYVEPAAGVGLRIMIQKQSRANLTIDYGWGLNGEGAFYLNLNEYF